MLSFWKWEIKLKKQASNSEKFYITSFNLIEVCYMIVQSFRFKFIPSSTSILTGSKGYLNFHL